MNRICLIFDLDGTLVDSEGLGNQGYADLIPEISESVRELTHRYQGGKLADILRDIEQRYDISLPDDFDIRYRKYVAELFEKELKPIPGAIEMLERNTYPCCIASSGPLTKMKHSLGITGLARYFGPNIYSAYEIQSWKPDPDLFLHAAKEMDHRPHECIVIEDSPIGVAAAHAAGMPVLHFNAAAVKPVSTMYRNFASMDELSVLLENLGNST